MKGFPRFVLISAAMAVSLSAILYGLHFLIFHDVRASLSLLLGDLAYLPLEVLLVVIIIERLLSQREKQNVTLKLNMVIGAFSAKSATNCYLSWRPYSTRVGLI